jgi:hypothetical protein
MESQPEGRGLRSDGPRVDAAHLAEVPERPGLVGLGESAYLAQRKYLSQWA